MSNGPDVVAATSGDTIRLVLPGEPLYGRIARVATSSLGLRLGLAFAEIEDLRIAVDETVILLLHPGGGAGSVTFDFSLQPHQLVIEATADPAESGKGEPARAGADPGARRRFDEIVGDVVDEHQVDPLNRRVRLVKRY